MRRTLPLLLLVSLASLSAQETVPIPLGSVLRRLFPKDMIEPATAFLNKPQQARVAKLADQNFERGMVFRYQIRDGEGKSIATAYLDRHRVRSKMETVLVVVGLKGRIKRVEVLAFAEPKVYLPREGWYRQFDGKALGPGLRLRHEIDAVSGATLSARACTRAARRVLAIHRVLAALAEEKPE